ncbi:unnamed protein product, partial [Symbiodinium sp. CCMP2592]
DPVLDDIKNKLHHKAPHFFMVLREMHVDQNTWVVALALVSHSKEGLERAAHVTSIAASQLQLWDDWENATPQQVENAWRSPSKMVTWHCRKAMEELTTG